MAGTGLGHRAGYGEGRPYADVEAARTRPGTIGSLDIAYHDLETAVVKKALSDYVQHMAARIDHVHRSAAAYAAMIPGPAAAGDLRLLIMRDSTRIIAAKRESDPSNQPARVT